MPQDQDPTDLVDEWPLPLSAADRKRVKAILLAAHAAYLRGQFDDPYKWIDPIQKAFSDTAQLLFNANLLTAELLENQLRLLLVEAGIAFHWFYWAANESLTEIFPRYLGHASTWDAFNGKFSMIFLAEIAEWRGKLLEREAANATEIESEPESKEITRRKNLLAEYKAATSTRSNQRIYQARNSGIHKPEFYQWLNGALPADSTMTVSLERFLLAKKSPIPRKPKP
jgi:hypothetical protein